MGRLSQSGVNALSTITIPADSEISPNSVSNSIVSQSSTLQLAMTTAAKNTGGISDVLHSGISVNDLSANVDENSVTVIGYDVQTDKATRPAIGLSSGLVTFALAAILVTVACPTS